MTEEVEIEVGDIVDNGYRAFRVLAVDRDDVWVRQRTIPFEALTFKKDNLKIIIKVNHD